MRKSLLRGSSVFSSHTLAAGVLCFIGAVLAMVSFAQNPGGWSIFPSANTSTTQTNYLFGVTCASGTECWAVGGYNNGSFDQTLIERWNGTAWAIVSSPNKSTTDDHFLSSITCASTSECWTVGYYSSGDSRLRQTLIQRWNGNSWSIVTSPNVNTTLNNSLNSVACTSASECWAVGDYYNGSIEQTLIQKWNGTSWHIVQSANISNSVGDYLNGVACTSSSDCWAVGYYYDNNGFGRTLTEHWNGVSWAAVAAPINGSTATFQAVTCSSVSDCWAVGNFYNGSVDQTLIEQWNGNSWSIVNSPSTGSTQNNLFYGIACPAASQCWASGVYFNNGGADHPFIEHWDGVSWSIDSATTNYADLYRITCSSVSQCWAVGEYYDGSGIDQTLIETFTPPLVITSVSRPSNGHFIITGKTIPSFSVNIDASSDLVTPFSQIGTTSSDANGVFQFDDAAASTMSSRFYRASHP